MTPLADIPLNSWCWLLGAASLVVLGTKSVIGYRKSRGELAKYMAWFSWVFLPCLLAFSVPALFTLDPDILRITSLIGEFFFFMGLVTQAAILWCLILRRYFSIWYATMPVAIIGIACWLYDVPRSQLTLEHNFINYYDPRAVSIIIAILMVSLFVPVGIYFIRAAGKQSGAKATVTSFALGMMYVGIGLSTASEELLARQLLTPYSAIVNLLIAAMLLVALILPWRLTVKLPAPIQAAAPPNPKPTQ
jgi:hypothetical protein